MTIDIEEIIKSKANLDSLDYDEKVVLDLFHFLEKYIQDGIDDSLSRNMLFLKLKKNFQKNLQAFLKQHKIQIKKSILLFYYKKFIGMGKIKENDYLTKILMKKPANDILWNQSNHSLNITNSRRTRF